MKLSKDLACVSDPNCTDNLFTGPDPKGQSQTISLPLEEDPLPAYYWSITPIGPLPYSELGTASEPRGFRISSDATKTTPVYPTQNGYIPYKWSNMYFEWTTVPGAQQYKLTVMSKNTDGTPGAEVYSNTFATATPSSDGNQLQHLSDVGTTDKNGYCWKVQAIGPNGLEGLVSDTWCYSMTPDQPVLISPAKDAADVDFHSVTFTWDSEWAPNGYTIGITEGSGPPVSYVPASGKSYSTVLSAGKTYAWEVRAGIDASHVSGSEVWHFTTKCEALPPPAYIGPQGVFACGSSSSSTYQETMKWNPVPGAVQYEVTLEWAKSAPNDFQSNKDSLGSHKTSSTSWGPKTFDKGKYYTWEIRTQNACGDWGSWISYYFVCNP